MMLGPQLKQSDSGQPGKAPAKEVGAILRCAGPEGEVLGRACGDRLLSSDLLDIPMAGHTLPDQHGQLWAGR